MTDAGVRQAVKAFIETEPFFPRPFSHDSYAENLWQIFCHRYIEAASKLVDGITQNHLPERFIEMVTFELKKRDQPASAECQPEPHLGPASSARSRGPNRGRRDRGSGGRGEYRGQDRRTSGSARDARGSPYFGNNRGNRGSR